MPEIPDSEFEKIFRKSAQKLKPEFKPEAWDKMEKLLDKEDRKAFWWRTGTVLLLLFLIGFGGTLFYKHISGDSRLKKHTNRLAISDEKSTENAKAIELNKQGHEDERNGNKNLENPKNSTNRESIEKRELEDGEKNSLIENGKLKKEEEFADNGTKKTTNKTALEVVKSNQIISGKEEEKKAEKGLTDKENGKSADKTALEVVKSNQIISGKEEEKKAEKGLTDKGNGGSADKTALELVKSNQIISRKEEEKKGKDNNGEITGGDDSKRIEENKILVSGKEMEKVSVEFPLLALNAISNFLLNEECPNCIETTKIEGLVEKKTDSVISSVPKRKLIAGITLAPDFSGVGLGTFNGIRAGTRTSLTLDYAIKDRFYLTSGVVLSKKVYQADASEYETKDRYWNGAGIPEFINADCNVLEIPLGLRYDLATNSKRRWFAQTSISSFWMLKEVYEYKYDSDYNPPPNRRDGWEGTNENKHLWSVLQFGFGYERQVGKKIGFQIAPFLQTLLGGIGHGNVSLFSFGTEFTLRYNFLSK